MNFRLGRHTHKRKETRLKIPKKELPLPYNATNSKGNPISISKKADSIFMNPVGDYSI